MLISYFTNARVGNEMSGVYRSKGFVIIIMVLCDHIQIINHSSYGIHLLEAK